MSLQLSRLSDIDVLPPRAVAPLKRDSNPVPTRVVGMDAAAADETTPGQESNDGSIAIEGRAWKRGRIWQILRCVGEATFLILWMLVFSYPVIMMAISYHLGLL